MDVHKKHKFIVPVNTSTRWLKPAQPEEPIFLIPTLLMEGPFRQSVAVLFNLFVIAEPLTYFR